MKRERSEKGLGNFSCFAEQTQEDVAEYDVSQCPTSPQESYCVKEKLKLMNEV